MKRGNHIIQLKSYARATSFNDNSTHSDKQ